MSESDDKGRPAILDKYPYRIILARWFFAAAEMGLASYLVFCFKFDIGLLFLIYGFVSAFVLLPLIRCVRCYYYGKRCNFGWGILVSKLFPRVDGDSYYAIYGYSFLFWPLRIFPIGAGLLTVLDGVLGGFKFFPQAIFGIYLVVLFLHRRYYRSIACRRCHQNAVCPVYDIMNTRRNIGTEKSVVS